MANFYFRECDKNKRKTCKSENEVNAWMKDKFLMFVHNEKLIHIRIGGPEMYTERQKILFFPLKQSEIPVLHFSAQ